MYQEVFAKTSVLLTEVGLQNGDAQLYNEFSEKAGELLDAARHPWMQVHASLLAYLHYLRAVPGVGWLRPKVDYHR